MNRSDVKRLFDIIAYQQAQFPKEDSLSAKVDGQWKKWSTKDFIDQANQVSLGLIQLGVNPGDKVALISNNRPEWNICDIGILQIGAIDVPVYPTIPENDYVFIFNDAEIKVCFVSDQELYDKVIHVKGEIPSLEHVFTYDMVEGASSWTDVLDRSKDQDIDQLTSLKDAIKGSDLATLIYTSGTTGVPKGVMLSHDNLVSNAWASTERLPVDNKAKSLSFLPVSHVYERMVQYLYMLNGVSIYFAESMETIGDNIREVQPHVFTAVPRLLEKVYDKIMAKGEELSGIKRMLFFWAVGLGHRYEPYGANGAWYEFQLGIARKLIFSKWQAALGGNVRAVASGSAALQPRLARVFLAAGIPVMEGYGLTETSPVISVNCEDDKGVKIGSVGRALDGVEVKIAEDGEILTKGPNLMMGYYNKPDLTKEVIDEEGWFHTGDIGELDSDGFLSITDRKKEIFKTSGGKYIAPQVMENKFKESRFIEQIMVLGEYQKHPSALIVPNAAFLEEWCIRKNISASSIEEMIQMDRIKDRIGQEVDKYNSTFGSWEQVKKFELLAKEWSVESGELTPSLKLKRKVIMERYKHLVDKIYS